MKKILFFIIVISVLSFIFVQCDKTNISSKENTESDSYDAYSKVMKIFREKGIKVVETPRKKIESRNNSSCYQNNTDSCLYVGYIYDTVYVPNVCSEAAVEYNLYWCENSGKLNITDFRAQPLSPACDNIWDWWESLFTQGHYTEFSLSVDSFEYAASIPAEENIAYAFAVAYNRFCPNETFIANFHRQLCYQHCVKYLGKNKWPRFEIFKVGCGSKCCKRTREFCVNPDGSTVLSYNHFEELSGECNPNLTGFECNDGYLIGDCGRICGPPPTN